jgi:tRNA(fMet)-specific endonuclease VapC
VTDYLIDTDWLIDVLVGQPATLESIESLRSSGTLSTSVISVGELFEGAFRAGNVARHVNSLRGFIAGFGVINLSVPIMQRFGELRANLRRAGQLIPDFDLLISATALELDMTLVTRNMRHFHASMVCRCTDAGRQRFVIPGNAAPEHQRGLAAAALPLRAGRVFATAAP